MSPPTWQATVLTLFPEMFPGPLQYALAGKALQQSIWSINTINIRDFASGKHRSVDDTPFGGGAGMVMRADVIDAALKSITPLSPDIPLVYLSPRGQPFNQKIAENFASKKGIILLCGRYEGIDQRILQLWKPQEISIGDYILAGGEMAAFTVLESCIRLLPGVIGQPDSLKEESFATGLLEYPQYTKPAVWGGLSVPPVLLSGHHDEIRRWRQRMAEEITKECRPDLWQVYLKLKKE